MCHVPTLEELRVPRSFYSLLAVHSGVARAFALRSTLSLRSCSSAQFPRFPMDHWTGYQQITPLRHFALLWTSVGFKKRGRFRIVRHTLLVPLLEAACSSVSRNVLLAVWRRVSSCLLAVCTSLSPLSMTDEFVMLVALRRSFFHDNFSQKNRRSWSWAWKKRHGSFLAWARCQH